MRSLHHEELGWVSGAGETIPVLGGGDGTTPTDPLVRNNNGYGNGAESGPPPGNSGLHNPGLLEDNRGPRGDR